MKRVWVTNKISNSYLHVRQLPIVPPFQNQDDLGQFLSNVFPEIAKKIIDDLKSRR